MTSPSLPAFLAFSDGEKRPCSVAFTRRPLPNVQEFEPARVIAIGRSKLLPLSRSDPPRRPSSYERIPAAWAKNGYFRLPTAALCSRTAVADRPADRRQVTRSCPWVRPRYSQLPRSQEIAATFKLRSLWCIFRALAVKLMMMRYRSPDTGRSPNSFCVLAALLTALALSACGAAKCEQPIAERVVLDVISVGVYELQRAADCPGDEEFARLKGAAAGGDPGAQYMLLQRERVEQSTLIDLPIAHHRLYSSLDDGSESATAEYCNPRLFQHNRPEVALGSGLGIPSYLGPRK